MKRTLSFLCLNWVEKMLLTAETKQNFVGVVCCLIGKTVIIIPNHNSKTMIGCANWIKKFRLCDMSHKSKEKVTSHVSSKQGLIWQAFSWGAAVQAGTYPHSVCGTFPQIWTLLCIVNPSFTHMNLLKIRSLNMNQFLECQMKRFTIMKILAFLNLFEIMTLFVHNRFNKFMNFFRNGS